jgi:hypothetical protein
MKTAIDSQKRVGRGWLWTACLDGMFISSSVVLVSYMMAERDRR